MDKRFQGRNDVSTVSVAVSDGAGHFPAVAMNISHSGLAIDGVPHELNHRVEILTLNVSSPSGQSYLLRAMPRWVSENRRKKTVGLRIFSAPRDWFRFVDNF
jgi:hypothetical protein